MNRVKIPKSLQGVLWSKDVDNLDLEKDKIYIINQILSYGTLKHFIWLFNNYTKKTALEIFLTKPVKNYTSSRFSFLKNIIFPFAKTNLNINHYVKNTPRDIR